MNHIPLNSIDGNTASKLTAIPSKAQKRARSLFDDVEAEFEIAASAAITGQLVVESDNAATAEGLSDLATSTVEAGAMGILRQARLNLEAQSMQVAERIQQYYAEKALQRAGQGGARQPNDVVDVASREVPSDHHQDGS